MFAATVILTIAIGVGATTSIVTVVNGVLLNPLPYRDADRLVRIWEVNRAAARAQEHWSVTKANFRDWRDMNRVFDGIAPFYVQPATLTGLGDAELLEASLVTAGFLRVLGAKPIRGRLFLGEEDHPGADRVVVLSHRIWQRVLGGDPKVIGRTVSVDGQSHTIVGVLEPGFDFMFRGIELWRLYRIPDSDFENRKSHSVGVIARMKPGITVEQAQTEMDQIADRIRLAYPEWMTDWGVNVEPLHEAFVGGLRPTLMAFLAGATVLLLITTVNVASLLLARATGRRREIAVRTALGAARRQLVCQSITDSLLLSVAGGALGVALATIGTAALVALAPNLPRADEIAIDAHVLAFAVVVSLVTGVVVGMLPVLQTSSVRVYEALKEAGRTSVTGEKQRLRQVLVVAEIALAMVLLVSAGLVTRTFVRLVSVDPGFKAERILTAAVRLPHSTYPEMREISAFYDQLLEETRAIPGVRSAALTRFLPLASNPWYHSFTMFGKPRNEDETLISALHPISPDYFATLGIQLLRGRAITEADNAEAPHVLVINESMRRQFWPDEDPIGQRIHVRPDPEGGPLSHVR